MAHSKKCFKCDQTKDISEFYKHAQMGDGHLNKCKSCTKNDARIHRANNLYKIMAYDKLRAKQPHRILSAINQTKKWRGLDKRRVKCHSAVARAIRRGILEKKNCEWCGNKNSVAHHEDYDKPLDVIWLCNPCHKKRHFQIKNNI